MSLWADSADSGAPFGSLRKGPGHLEAVERVKDWTRRRFALGDDETILVSEVACSLAGGPALETVIAFWTADGTRHHFKVFKPVDDVADEDLPPAWLKDALALAEGAACACC
jgi:hypothetical protein